MARTVHEIKRQMTDAFMADDTLRERYGFKDGDTFSSRFSVASIESILFFIIASAHYVLERIFDQYKQINSSVVATIPWYHQQALNYQHGDKLELDEATLRWQYPIVDESKRLVRYVSVKDLGTSIRVLVSKDKDGLPEPLTEDELRSVTAYMSSIKIAGVVLSVRSLPADILSITASIQLDPLVYLPSGVRIRDGKRPVELAIRSYLRDITYGGVFNKTKLVDAIQQVEGVIDVDLGECSAEPHRGVKRVIQGNNYSARSGCFLAPTLTSTLSYNY